MINKIKDYWIEVFKIEPYKQYTPTILIFIVGLVMGGTGIAMIVLAFVSWEINALGVRGFIAVTALAITAFAVPPLLNFKKQ